MARRKPWEVSDELWAVIEPLLPRHERRYRYPGRKRIDDRKTLQGVLFVLYTGVQWEFLPQELGFGSGPTCWRRLAEWQEAGVWEREPVGKRVTARIALLDDLGGDVTGRRPPSSSQRSPSAHAFADGLMRSGALQGAMSMGERSGRARCRRVGRRHRPEASRATSTPTSPTSSGSTSVTFSVSRLPHPADSLSSPAC
jgi:transposase